MSEPVQDSKYRAPALEKGLDVLELLAMQMRPLNLSQISAELGRSVSELFRMVQTLELRGYLVHNGDGYELTNKLFSLGLSSGPSQNLLASALPQMQSLSDETRQSCHLAVSSDNLMVVVARVEAPGALGFSVRVGHIKPLTQTTSGVVLYAFSAAETQTKWAKKLRTDLNDEEWSGFDKRVHTARANGFAVLKSDYVEAVTDCSFPIYGQKGIVAALTMPHLKTYDSVELSLCQKFIAEKAKLISQSMGAQL